MNQPKASAIFRLRASRTTTGVVRRSSRDDSHHGVPESATRARLTERPTGYVYLVALPGDGRARVSIGVGEAESTLERLVVVKRFATSSLEPKRSDLDRELELAALLEHPSIVRTLRVDGVGSDECRYAVTEYLDGVGLHELLDSVAAEGCSIPAAAVTQILISLLDAVHHGQRTAPLEASRRLCELPVTASDVFITYDGRVKLLGFKTGRRVAGTGGEPVVDALLSRHHTPALARLLACYARVARSREHSALASWVTARGQLPDLRCEGSAELAEIMKRVNSIGRARQAARLVAAFARWRGERASLEERSRRRPQSSPVTLR